MQRSSLLHAKQVGGIKPLEVFRAMQLGAFPAPPMTRRFLETHFGSELAMRNVSSLKLNAMESSSCNALLRFLFYQRFLNIPIRVITMDVEFTGLPTFGVDGPSEDITELGAYCPIRGRVFSTLVKAEKKIPQKVEKLTGISDDLLVNEGVPFPLAWREFLNFIEGESVSVSENELNSSAESSVQYDPFDEKRIPSTLPKIQGSTHEIPPRVLLLSHGGKAADVTMIDWALKKNNLPMPAHIKFADTLSIIQDLHQRRPVTQDKHPPSYNLQELCSWMKLKVPKKTHRAGPDAAMTWSVLFHTMDRYGDETLTPHQQLVLRFFENDAVQLMMESEKATRSQSDVVAEGKTDDMEVMDLDLESILN